MQALRTNRLIMTGAAVFVIGAGLTLIGLRSSKAEDRPLTRAPSKTTETSTVGRSANKTGFVLDEGMEAVALSVDGAPGLSGYAGAGDVVHVYATVKSAPGGKPFSKRILTSVKVLDVTAPIRGGRGETKYLLALSHANAERLIFAAKFESVWLSLARPDDKNLGTTTRTYSNAF
jgi:Flp pilus assembly protein CpaB